MPAPLLSVSQQLAAFYSSVFRSCQSFSPKSKAKVTSIYMMMGGLANFVIPLITGYLSNIGLQYIIVLDFYFRAAGPDYRNYCFYPLLPRFLLFLRMMCGLASANLAPG